MKITVEKEPVLGTPLSEVPFGSVVTRVCSPKVFYLVIATMDGTGRRALVTLGGGSYKAEIPVGEAVNVVEAELVIGPRPKLSANTEEYELRRKLELARDAAGHRPRRPTNVEVHELNRKLQLARETLAWIEDQFPYSKAAKHATATLEQIK